MRLYPAMVKVALVCAALSACAVDPVELPDVIEKTPCLGLVCGNAAILGYSRFWELDATGAAYSPMGRVKIVDFRNAANVVMKPVVSGYTLLGDIGGALYGPAAIVGSHLWIDSELGEHFKLTLQSVGNVAYVEGGYDPMVSIPTYFWTVQQSVGPNLTPPVPLCENAKIDLYFKDAILFTGDRYDGATATVKAYGNTQPWFNIACKEDVLWKQVLFRYVTVAQGPPSLVARNTSIAAIHADYCGKNHPYTELGTDVDWANRSHTLWIDPGHPNVEAIWAGGKAVCLTHPRKVPKASIDCGSAAVPDDCSAAQIAHWDTFGEMITYVP